jgi:glutathione peroxidase
MFEKIDVNGADAHPLYKWLTSEKRGPRHPGDQVEFHQVPAAPRRYRLQALRATTKPEEIPRDIESLLAEQPA